MLAKSVTIDKIEIIGDFGCIQVREKTSILEDGVEISSSFHRRVISPLDDVTTEPDNLKAVAQIFHTEEVKAAYQDHLASL